MTKSKKKNEAAEAAPDDGDGMIRDERFQIAQTHPQFQKLHTKKFQKPFQSDGKDGDGGSGEMSGELIPVLPGEGGEIDDRFKAMLTDSRFAIGGDIGVAEGGVDKYGRGQKKKKAKKKKKDDVNEEGIKSGDDTSDSDDSDADADDTGDGDDKEDDGGEMPEDPESRIAYLTALSRGEIDVSDSSEDEDESSDEDNGGNSSDDDSTGSEDSIYGKAGVLDPSTKDEILPDENDLTYDDSHFLAICNMDWGNIRAVDLLAIISSFAPPGTVKYVKVYPSDFGKERMENDKTLGPKGIWKREKVQNGDDDFADDASNTHQKFDSSDESSNDTDEDDKIEKVKKVNDEEIVVSDNESIDEELLVKTYGHFSSNPDDELRENDFDSEKLRAYEVSKLKYYFAVAEFTSTAAANQVYKELDGMEIGGSSSKVDLRAIPDDEIENAVKERDLRDVASIIPSNYSSPDFVVDALQQTDVQCTWEEGDKNRERLLTQYGVGNAAWAAMTEGDDLKAYLASDISSDEEDSDDDGEEGESGVNAGKGKVTNMRKLLGLACSDDDDDDILQDESGNKSNDDDEDSFFGSGAAGLSDDKDSDNEGGMQMTYVPGKSDLTEKIRTKLKEKKEGVTELTPWEQYRAKRKDKWKAKKRAQKEEKAAVKDAEIGMITKKTSKKSREEENRAPSTKEELNLLLAGDNDEETAKDFHMRDLVRMEKNKSKKLKGSRKRKDDALRGDAVGLDFQLDTNDSRFAAVLDGTDSNFGINKTDPQYKETAAMRQILAEQSQRRKTKKRRKTKITSTDANADKMVGDNGPESGGALALSSLVKSLKAKVNK
mmetsp:Transcript_27465/g.40575  ORF Transcript_27465/g.40575 Transcript_27465/m.40575 type:complete len:828 (-) Transcript_27465:75-2558(-)